MIDKQRELLIRSVSDERPIIVFRFGLSYAFYLPYEILICRDDNVFERFIVSIKHCCYARTLAW